MDIMHIEGKNMTDKYDPSEKFGVQTDAETLKQAAIFAAKIKKQKKVNNEKTKPLDNE